jgi:hypothetical protein
MTELSDDQSKESHEIARKVYADIVSHVNSSFPDDTYKQWAVLTGILLSCVTSAICSNIKKGSRYQAAINLIGWWLNAIKDGIETADD